MGILNFRLNRPAETLRQDWSSQELGHFYRAHRLLEASGVYFGLDTGLSDEGDPWMVFFDHDSADVFLHVARIDGVCVMISERLGMVLSGADVAQLMDRFAAFMTQRLEIGRERDPKVVVHPAARVILSLSMLFLLFKFDQGSSVFAREQAATAEAAQRKELAVLPRLQQVYLRLADAVHDNPAAVAALAGILLTAELIGSELNGPRPETGLSVGELVAELDALVSPEEGVHTAEIAADVLNPAQGAEAAPDQAEIVLADSSVLGTLDELLSAVTAIASEDVADEAPNWVDVEHAEVISLAGLAPVPEAPAKKPAGAITTPEPEPAAETITTGSSTTADVLIASILQPIVDWDWTALKGGEVIVIGSDDGIDIDLALPGDLVTTVAQRLDFSISDLGTFESDLADLVSTKVSGQLLQSMLGNVLAGLGHYDVEFENGQVFIDQHFTGDIGELAMWQNSMSDGSSLIVVGSAALLQELIG